MAWIALATAALTVHPVTADFGGATLVDNSSRYNRYDFVLTNTTHERQEVAVCPHRIEIAIHAAQVVREPAFAVSFDDGKWTRECTVHWLAPGEKVTMRTYFREWWANEQGAPRTLKRVEAETSVGTFALNFTPSHRRGQVVVQASSAYPVIK
jgi:hypothetical protein